MLGEQALAALMRLAQQGDRDAYGQLLRACQIWLRAYYRGRVMPAQADDLVQETLLAVHDKLASWDPSRPFLPWLAAIARYRWIDHLRRTARAAECELDPDLLIHSVEPAIAARISLTGLFAHLSQAQQRAIELVKIEGLSIAEAARATGQSESLVKVNIHRGLKKLARLIEKE